MFCTLYYSNISLEYYTKKIYQQCLSKIAAPKASGCNILIVSLSYAYIMAVGRLRLALIEILYEATMHAHAVAYIRPA